MHNGLVEGLEVTMNRFGSYDASACTNFRGPLRMVQMMVAWVRKG
jgi:hypothetical protein